MEYSIGNKYNESVYILCIFNVFLFIQFGNSINGNHE